jgi:hypothetical protein
MFVTTKFFATAMVAALAVGWGEELLAELPDNTPEIKRYLELMGYKVEQKEEVLFAERSQESMRISKRNDGILVVVSFGGSDASKSHRGEFLEFVNRLNADAVAIRAHVCPHGNLHFQSWFAGEFERVRFDVFLETWNSDVPRLLRQNQTDARRFLR